MLVMVAWLYYFGPVVRQTIRLNHVVEDANTLAAGTQKEKEAVSFDPSIPFKNTSAVAGFFQLGFTIFN